MADQLSRPVNLLQFSPPGTWLGLSKEDFVRYQREDHAWGDLINYLGGGRLNKRKVLPAHLDKFELFEDVLYYVREAKDGNLNYTLVVPECLVNKALELAHADTGHFGQFKSIKRAEAYFYFPNLRTKVNKFIKSCIPCQQYKPGTTFSH